MQSTSVDLAPILSVAAQFLWALLPVVLSALANKAMKYYGIAADSQANTLLHSGVDRAVQYAQSAIVSKVGLKNYTIDTKNAAIASVVNYASANLAQTMDHLGVTPSSLAQLVANKLDVAVGIPVDANAPTVG